MIRWLMNILIASMIFAPTRDYIAKPSDFNLTAEDAWPQTEDNTKLHGWFFGAAQPKSAIIFLHGNAANISGLLSYVEGWTERDVSVLLIDYRGYGQSEGSIKHGKDIFLDAEAGVNWLEKQKGFTPSNIILYGQSIGSAPAIELATKQEFQALILEAPFTSTAELSKLHYGFNPNKLLGDFAYENEKKISGIKCPVFIMHGTQDEVSPFSMGKRLFEAAAEPKMFFEVSNAMHNDLSIVAGDDFFEKPYRFVVK